MTQNVESQGSAAPRGGTLTNKVLLVDDDEPTAKVIAIGLERAGFAVRTARSGREAIESFGSSIADLLLVDLCMPEMDGFAVLRHSLEQGWARRVIVFTGMATVPLAVEAMRLGATDFLTKPLDMAVLREVVSRTLGGVGAAQGADLQEWRQRFAPTLIGQSATLITALRDVARVADTDCSVVITGESGTGKELVARALHDGSRRSGRPFVAVNCAAIPKELTESELFGHVRGAFSGAFEARPGRFMVADGGTLFLDEIGDMDLSTQTKLLRALQDQEITPVGDSQPHKVDVRVITATNRNLVAMQEQGLFREDLFHRLNVVTIKLPALRERQSDIPQLVTRALAWANQRHGRAVDGISPDAIASLTAYAWPGNIRELQNIVERMVVIKAEGTLRRRDLPSFISGLTPPPLQLSDALGEEPIDPNMTLDTALEQLERRMATDALRRADGNKAKAAQILGLKRTTLVERLKRLGISDNGSPDDADESGSRRPQ